MLAGSTAAACGMLRGSADGPPTFEGCAARLRATVDAFGGRIGALVVDADNGAELLAIAADEGFVPASNVKLLTAAVALHTLGPGATLTTRLLHTGDVHAGELRGDLILRGGGDPSFAADGLQLLVQAVRSLGVRRIAGRVRGDDRWLGGEHRGRGWEWDDLDQDYAAPFGALCWEGNVTTVVDADGASRRVAVADPGAAAAGALAAALALGGVEVVGGDVATDGLEHGLGTVHSAPIATLLQPMLRDSDNLYAEQLWRVAAKVATGDGGSASAAAHAERELCALGVDTIGLVQVDGSGLSRLALARPRQLVAVLQAMLRAPYREAVWPALPVGGRTGTLRDRLVGAAVRGHVHAKTGTLTRVAALSGYLERPGRTPLVFSVVWNDFLCDPAEAQLTIDQFVAALATARP